MIFSIWKAWLTRIMTDRRLLDEVANLSPEQIRDARLDLSGIVLPRRVEPDDVMLQRVGWRADRACAGPEAHESHKSEERMSRTKLPRTSAGSSAPLRFSTTAVPVAP